MRRLALHIAYKNLGTTALALAGLWCLRLRSVTCLLAIAVAFGLHRLSLPAMCPRALAPPDAPRVGGWLNGLGGGALGAGMIVVVLELAHVRVVSLEGAAEAQVPTLSMMLGTLLFACGLSLQEFLQKRSVLTRPDKPDPAAGSVGTAYGGHFPA